MLVSDGVRQSDGREIDFSYIRDFDDDKRIRAEFMQKFGTRYGVKVHLEQMTWDTAWAELFSFVSQGKYPHVSHIGNTWVDSLARINVLRSFSAADIAKIGGPMSSLLPTGILAF